MNYGNSCEVVCIMQLHYYKMVGTSELCPFQIINVFTCLVHVHVCFSSSLLNVILMIVCVLICAHFEVCTCVYILLVLKYIMPAAFYLFSAPNAR